MLHFIFRIFTEYATLATVAVHCFMHLLLLYMVLTYPENDNAIGHLWACRYEVLIC